MGNCKCRQFLSLEICDDQDRFPLNNVAHQVKAWFRGMTDQAKQDRTKYDRAKQNGRYDRYRTAGS